MRKILFWAAVFSGVGAAYFMFKRGVPVQEIATETVNHPIGSLVNELKAAS